MKIEKEFTNDHQVKITVEFDPDTLIRYKHRAARKISETNKVPGFRPGKAPYNIALAQFGEYRITQEAIDLLLEKEYPDVIQQAEITPADSGTLEEIKSENPPIFVFKVPLEPEVKLGNYQDLRKSYEPGKLDNAKVEEYIDQLRRNASTIVPAKGSAAEGDLVYMSISAEDLDKQDGDDKVIFTSQPQQVIIPKKSEQKDTEWPFKGFTRKLIGKNSGESIELKHKFSSNEKRDDNLKGKNVVFRVEIQEVKSLELPELDANFAQTVGNYEDVDQMKEDITNKMTEDLNHSYDDKYYMDLIDEIRSRSTIKYPPQVLDKEIEKVQNRVEADLKRQHLDFETYLKIRKMNKDEFVEQEVKPAAIHRLERSLVMDAFSNSEGIKLNEDQMSETIKTILTELNADGSLLDMQKQLGEREFTNAITYEAANRSLNNQINQQLKLIATGKKDSQKLEQEGIEPVTEPEPVEPGNPAD